MPGKTYFVFAEENGEYHFNQKDDGKERFPMFLSEEKATSTLASLKSSDETGEYSSVKVVPFYMG